MADETKSDDQAAFVAAWNAIAAKLVLPMCRMLTAARRTSLKARLSDDAWRESYPAALAMIENSEFLRGVNDRSWCASVDWFLRPNSVARILEGQYADKRPGGFPPGATKAHLSSLATDWIDRAHWVGGEKVVQDSIRFAILECGNDEAFVRGQIEKVCERAKPWLWREACLAEFKRRQSAPRGKPEHFQDITPVGDLVAKIAGPKADAPQVKIRFARIVDRLNAGQEVILYGSGKINRYRVVKGKSGKPEIIGPSGKRDFLRESDLVNIHEE